MSVSLVSVLGVKQVVKVRVLGNQEQAAALGDTLNTCNEAAAWLSARMHADRVHRKYDAQKRFYTELKRRFGLSAQPAIRVIATSNSPILATVSNDSRSAVRSGANGATAL